MKALESSSIKKAAMAAQTAIKHQKATKTTANRKSGSNLRASVTEGGVWARDNSSAIENKRWAPLPSSKTSRMCSIVMAEGPAAALVSQSAHQMQTLFRRGRTAHQEQSPRQVSGSGHEVQAVSAVDPAMHPESDGSLVRGYSLPLVVGLLDNPHLVQTLGAHCPSVQILSWCVARAFSVPQNHFPHIVCFVSTTATTDFLRKPGIVPPNLFL